MITKAQQAELKHMAQVANRRLKVASAEARKAYEHYINQYHTELKTNDLRLFQTQAAKTESEYKQRIEELNRFLNSKYTTRRGYNAAIKRGLKKAAEKLNKDEYIISPAELAVIAKETGGASENYAGFYRALENVTAKKLTEDVNELNEDELLNAIYDRKSEQEAAEAAIKAREERDKQVESILKDLKRAGMKKAKKNV